MERLLLDVLRNGKISLVVKSLFFLGLFADPRVRLIRNVGEKQEVIAPEVIGGSPSAFLKIYPGEGGVVTDTLVRLIFPDGGLDATEPDFVDRQCFVSGFGHGVCEDLEVGVDQRVGWPGTARMAGAYEVAGDGVPAGIGRALATRRRICSMTAPVVKLRRSTQSRRAVVSHSISAEFESSSSTEQSKLM